MHCRAISWLAGILAGFLATVSVCAQAAPGDHFILLPKDLPPPGTTTPTDFDPDFVERPANALPHVPPGFAISLFASGLHHPRSLAVAPDGDVFVVLEGPGIVQRLRDADGDGKAEQIKEFAAALSGTQVRCGGRPIRGATAWRWPNSNA